MKVTKKTMSLAVFLLWLLCFGIFLLNTEQGFCLGFATVVKLIPGKVTIGRLSGRIMGPLIIENLTFESRGLKVQLNKLYLDWQLKKLLIGKFHITSLQVENFKVENKEKKAQVDTPAKKQKKNASVFSLPCDLKLADFQIINFSWQQGTETPIVIDNIRLHLDIIKNKSFVAEGEWRAKDSSFEFKGQLKDRWNLTWKLYSSNLSRLVPKVRGEAIGEGMIMGERNTPEISTNFKLTSFKYENITFAQLQGGLFFDLANIKSSYLGLKIFSAKIVSFNCNHLNLTGRTVPINKDRINFNLEIAPFIINSLHKNVKPLRIEAGRVSGEYGKKGLAVIGVIKLLGYDPIKLNLKVPYLKSLPELNDEQQLEGQLVWTTKKLDFLQFLIPNLQNINGLLKLDYKLSGTLVKPAITGTARLTDLDCYIRELNIRLQQGTVQIKNTLERIEYQGTFFSNNGSLQIIGDTLLSKKEPKSKINIAINDFLVINTQEYKAYVTAQLNLHVQKNDLILEGNVVIPRANIKPGYLAYGGMLPPEIVYVKKEKEQNTPELNLITHLKLRLGNSVYIDVSGLSGRLEGELALTDIPQQITTAHGDLHIKEGEYNLYGQQLQVTIGELHFLESDVTNPKVEVVAIRKITPATAAINSQGEGLVVGVRAYGLVESIKTDLFSYPQTLSKADILSYLITGKPTDQALGNKGQLLLQAASNFDLGGASEVSGLVNNLKKNLGFTEFGLTEEPRKAKANGAESKEKEPTGPNTAFVLGRFLTPKIYISCSMGLLDPLSIFRIKYFLNKYWSVHTESSSQGNGADLFYTLERN